jgi:hypothetical protein
VTNPELEGAAAALVSRGKGILAADETVPTLTKRFDGLKIESTPSSRRDYREMLLTTPGVAAFISGVILYDETIRQQSTDGSALVSVCSELGILPGIKVDRGAKPLAGSRGERITEGLDGLRERLAEYRELGARFAKWRAVFDLNDTLPTEACVTANFQLQRRDDVVPTAGQEDHARDGRRDVPAEAAQRRLGHLPDGRLLGTRGARHDHVRLEQHALEADSLLEEGVEDRVQHGARYLLASLDRMHAVHQHLRLDDGRDALLLRERRVATQCMGGGAGERCGGAGRLR